MTTPSLPVPGGSSNVWGIGLNAFLGVSHTADGSLTGTVNVVAYGADPTGAAYSDTAMAAALTKLGTSAGNIVFPAGTYKFANSYVFGPGQGIATNLPNASVMLFYYGSGTFIHSYDINFGSSGDPSLGGEFSGFTIDGTHAGSAAKGFWTGDLNGLNISITIQNFTGATAMGAWFANATTNGGSEYGSATINTYNNTNNIVFDNASGGPANPSFDAIDFWFGLILYQNQNGIIWQNECNQYAGSLTVFCEAWGAVSNTGTVLSFGPDSSSGAGVRNVAVQINCECGSGTGTVGPVSVALGAHAFFMMNTGNMSFRNQGGNFKASVNVANPSFTFAGWLEFDATGDTLPNASADGFGFMVMGGALETPSTSTFAGPGTTGIIYNADGNTFTTTLNSGANTFTLANLIPGTAQKMVWIVTQPSSGAAGTLTLTGAKTTAGSGVLTLSSTNGYVDVIDLFTPDGVNLYASVRGLHYHL